MAPSDFSRVRSGVAAAIRLLAGPNARRPSTFRRIARVGLSRRRLRRGADVAWNIQDSRARVAKKARAHLIAQNNESSFGCINMRNFGRPRTSHWKRLRARCANSI